MIPKFRAWGVERSPGAEQSAPEMHYDVSVVTTFSDKETLVIADFGMWSDDEYNGSIIDDAIVMQSTGILDKNGQEIFEGDILKNKDYPELRFVCKRSDMRPAYIFSTNNNLKILQLWNDEQIDWEIIGNIYENNDLVEV